MFRKSAFLIPALGLFAVLGLGIKAEAHIDLVTPEPVLHGRAIVDGQQALKSEPFGAPGVDISTAPVTVAKAGGTIEVEADVYVYHPGEIVVLYTRDETGANVEPAWSIPEEGAEIPHTNLLYKGKTPTPDEGTTFRATVPLPDMEGEIILVVRQVMHDKLDKMPDGSVSLKRIYYHQAARIKLEK